MERKNLNTNTMQKMSWIQYHWIDEVVNQLCLFKMFELCQLQRWKMTTKKFYNPFSDLKMLHWKKLIKTVICRGMGGWWLLMGEFNLIKK